MLWGLLTASAAYDFRNSLVLEDRERSLAETARVTAGRIARPAEQSEVVPEKDFTAHLPHRPDLARLLNELSQDTKQSDVVIDSIQVIERPADPAQLARTDVSMRLRGAYPALKSVLRDVTDRLPAVTISQVRFRRIAPGLAEASVLFATWSSAPVVAAAGVK